MKYLTFEDCDIDMLRHIYNKSNRYSVIALTTGHSQSGKTTWIWYICNRICQIRKYGYAALDPLARCNNWKEWDWKKFSATDAQSFVEIWNNNSDAVMTLSEASTSLYFMDWFKVMSRVFNSTTTVLGKQHNICFLDTVYEGELLKNIKGKIDYRIEMHRREDWRNNANVRSGWSLIDYLRCRWLLITDNESNWKYTKRILLEAKKYTDFVASTQKRNEAEENERRVGLRPSERDIELAYEAQEIKNNLTKPPVIIRRD